MDFHDSIAAIATPVGMGGVGIVKISGLRAYEVARKIFRKRRNTSAPMLRPYQFHVGQVFDPSTQAVLDEALLVYMPAPRSYTREDVVEIQCHSGYLVLQRILDLVLSHEGLRLAEPGEFTRRAFVNGRIDLTQAEAVIDLIHARTSSGLRQATGQLGGLLARGIAALKGKLIAILVSVESGIDFPEEDLDTQPLPAILSGLHDLRCEIGALLDTYEEGKIVREGVKATIIGRPNVGKSSLLNALLEEERAIVSHLPGTTRDTIEESINLQGVAVTLTDTAGLPLYLIADPAEKKGVDLARTKAFLADVVLFVLDVSSPLTENDVRIAQEFQDKHKIVVLNKADLPPILAMRSLPESLQGCPVFSVSAKYHQGIRELKQGIREVIVGHGELILSPPMFINRTRHKVSLEKAMNSLLEATKSLERGLSAEFMALDLKRALGFLGEIGGETTNEDILDHIFSEFCIGK